VHLIASDSTRTRRLRYVSGNRQQNTRGAWQFHLHCFIFRTLQVCLTSCQRFDVANSLTNNGILRRTYESLGVHYTHQIFSGFRFGIASERFGSQ